MSATTSDFLRQLRTLAARQAMGDFSDQQLLERFRLEHSEAAFAVLVQRHGPMVLSVCRRVLHHVQDAEDAFQATFLVLAKKAATLRQPPLLGAWLHGVAYHVALRLKAKTQRRAVHECCVDPLPSGDARDDITWRELRSVLDEELQRLPEKYRTPLVLCYLEARTQDEAARHLGWSKNTFGRRINQARQMLARRLTRRGLTLPAALTAPLLIDSAAQAALPPLLAASTIRTGLALASGQPIGALASASVVALAESGGQTLLASKVKWAFALMVAVSIAAGSVLTHQTLPIKSTATQPAAPPPQSPPARRASKETTEIKGRVLDPEGKPVAGARLFLLSEVTRKKANVLPQAATDKDGRFYFIMPSADFGPQGKGVLAATAKGFGLDWIDLNAKDKSKEITLRLVADDKPIEGRVLDLEGNPVAGVSVQVDSVAKRADGKDLDAFVEKLEKYLKEGTPGFPNKNSRPLPFFAARDEFQWKRIRPRGLDVPATVTTGKDGRFRLTGFGRERLIEVTIHGSTIAQTELYALTRSGPANGWVRRPANVWVYGHYGLYGCRIDHVAAPCKPIIGTVRDKRTGKPLAGIGIYVPQQIIVRAKTDSQGRYRIVGIGKSNEYEVNAGGTPYFGHRRGHVADTPALEPITVDFELERGIVVRGRLTDKSTGKPVQGEIYYHADPDNPHVKEFPDGSSGDQRDTSPDGSFAVLAIPGPGLLRVRAEDANGFVRAEVKGGFLHYHAEARINPSENDPKSMTCNIALEPARQLSGSVVGPDGKPLAEVYAAGRWPIFSHGLMQQERLQSDSFTVGGLKAGRPRTLVFLHPQKKLGKVVKLQGDETKPLLVRLAPLDAALTGRILDAKGRQWPGLTVSIGTLLGGRVFQDESYPPEFLWGYTAWMNLKVGGAATTDREGRFRIAEMMPGLKYVLFAYEENAPQGTPFAYHDRDLIVTIDPGKTKDLGDLKSKQSSGEPAKK